MEAADGYLWMLGEPYKTQGNNLHISAASGSYWHHSVAKSSKMIKVDKSTGYLNAKLTFVWQVYVFVHVKWYTVIQGALSLLSVKNSQS